MKYSNKNRKILWVAEIIFHLSEALYFNTLIQSNSIIGIKRRIKKEKKKREKFQFLVECTTAELDL